jgi:hypothetical protein
VGSNQVPTPRFAEAIASIQTASLRPDAVLTEIPAPTRIAPFALAVEARIAGPAGEDCSGSFVVLHNPEPPSVWQGDLRAVTLARAEVEEDLGADPFLAEVAWTWLVEALDAIGPLPAALSGTVTRTLSESFGALRPRGATVGLELRASWTPPTADVGTHLAAWLDFLARMGGIEPLPAGVARLHARR